MNSALPVPRASGPVCRPLRRTRPPGSLIALGSFLLLALAAITHSQAETLTLADCLRETVLNSPAIVEQQFGIQAAYGQRLTLRAVALPTLTVNGIGGYQGAQSAEVLQSAGVGPNGKPLPQTTSPRNSTAILIASGQFTQPIFDASIPPSWRLGTLGVDAARENFYVVATAQLFQARTLFNRALYYHQREELLHLTDEILNRNAQAQNALLAAGLGTRQGVLSSQVQRANFDPVLTANNGSYQTTVAALLQVMGRRLPAGKADPIAGITLVGRLDESPLEFDAEAAGREALANRPDLQSLRSLVKTYTENANVARAGYLPKLSIYLAAQYLPQTYVQSQNASTRAADRLQTTEIKPGIQGSWSVIDTGAVRGQTRQYEELRGMLADNLRKLEIAVSSDLAMVHGQAAAAREALGGLRGNVATSQDTLNIIQAGVAQGLNSQLEFLDAQNGVFETRLGALEAELTLSQAHAEFDRITGRYLRYVPDTTPPAGHPAPAKK